MRFPSRQVNIGNIPLGLHYPVRLQSMTSTSTGDVNATVEQSKRIFDAGADYVRISIPGMSDVEHLKNIKKNLSCSGYNNPLIADIHYRPEIAVEAAKIVEKVRINPGNYTIGKRSQTKNTKSYSSEAELEALNNKLLPLIKVCKEYGTAIRIGTNYGSLSERIIKKYGYTPEALAQSTLEFLKVFEYHGFRNSVISLKASNPLLMIQAYGRMSEILLEEDILCPMHIGVTEAGEGEDGRLKSAVGISTLLKWGIGDTVRVSLSEPPENEIPVAKSITGPFKDLFESKKNNASFKPPKYKVRKRFDLPGRQNAIVISEQNISNKSQKNEADVIWLKEPSKISSDNLYLTDNKDWVLSKNVYRLIKTPIEDSSSNDDKVKFIYAGNREAFLKINKKRKNIIVLADINDSLSLSDIEELLSSETEFPVAIKHSYSENKPDDLGIKLSLDFGSLLLLGKIQGLFITCDDLDSSSVVRTIFSLYQASGIRKEKTDYISCPTCSRTTFDLQKLLREVKSELPELPGLKIAVMGCTVNGIGEMADADYGLVGAAKGKVNIYKGQKLISRGINIEAACKALMVLLEQEGHIRTDETI